MQYTAKLARQTQLASISCGDGTREGKEGSSSNEECWGEADPNEEEGSTGLWKASC
jgi:hypothetical protein